MLDRQAIIASHNCSCLPAGGLGAQIGAWRRPPARLPIRPSSTNSSGRWGDPVLSIHHTAPQSTLLEDWTLNFKVKQQIKLSTLPMLPIPTNWLEYTKLTLYIKLQTYIRWILSTTNFSFVENMSKSCTQINVKTPQPLIWMEEDIPLDYGGVEPLSPQH